MTDLFKKYGSHLAAIVLFIAMVTIYFAPSVLEDKVMQQGDSMKFVGMVQELSDYYNKENTTSEWLGSMFSGMPAYQVGLPGASTHPLNYILNTVKSIEPTTAGMVLAGLIAFYLLMCIMGVNRWLAIAGAIAYALSSYNIIIIGAGHLTKAYAIAYMPLTIGGMYLVFKQKYLLGTLLFAFGTAASIMEGHLQITYYLALFCVFFYAGFVVQQWKNKTFNQLLKSTGYLVVGTVLAILCNLGTLHSNYEMSKTSLRGQSELTISDPNAAQGSAVHSTEKQSSGLDKDYAFQWSYGWKELMTFLVPNVYGGASGGTLDNTSTLYQEMRKHGAQVGPEIQTYTYWGDKPFTSGPVYFGAVVCFLFLFGMFIIKNPMKWWMLAGALFFTFLSLGRNFDLFNDFMFHYLPMYNKFRTPEMALVIPALVFPIIAIWGLHEFFTNKIDDKTFKKSFLWSVGITGGLSHILWIVPSLLLNFHSAFDAQFQSQIPDWYYKALLLDRADLASSDALRSLVFIIIAAAAVWFCHKSGYQQKFITWSSVGLMVLITLDLWFVDRRYVNDSNYTNKQLTASYQATAADQYILKDTDPSYRVLNLNNPWQETSTSYYHKSIGGYHAAKLLRYQELIDFRLNTEWMNIIKALQNAKTAEDILPVLAQSTSLNMLNMRYIIYNPGQAPIRNPYAYGNAWFADSYELVENADAEMTALNTLQPLKKTVIDKRFTEQLKGFSPQADSTATIQLESYRPNKLVYKSKTNSEQLAVFSEVYYQPGWVATIDGKEVPHFRADWTLRAMLVPAGEHTIEFAFRPTGYYTANNVAQTSGWILLLLLVGGIVFEVSKNRTAGKKTE